MKNLKYAFVAILVVLFALPQLRAQETKKKEEKKMTVKMIKEEDGSMTSFDTTINLDGDFDHEALARKLKEKYGIDVQMEDDGEYEVILKKSPDGSEEEMIWYEIEDEEVDGQRKIVLRSDKGDGDAKVIVKKMCVETDDNAKVDVWVDGEKHQKVFFKSAGNDSFVFKHGIQVKITDPDASELSAAGIKIRDKGLTVENLELMLKGEDAELSFHLSTSGKTSINLLNSAGQKIYSDKVKYFPGTYKKSLGLQLDEGEYFLQITQDNSAFIKKIKIRN